jgi:hypothetical protein
MALPKREAAPKSELEDFKQKTFLVSTIHCLCLDSLTIDPLPALDASTDSDFPDLFTKKCEQCSKLCDFSLETKDTQAKEDKAKYLVELDRIFAKPRIIRLLTPDLITVFLRMCLINVGRSCPSLRIVSSIECPDNVLDIAWPHLELVYNALKSLFGSKAATFVSDGPILAVLIANTVSADERERQAAKECLCALYRIVANLKQPLVALAVNQMCTGECSAELLGFVYDCVGDLQKVCPQGHRPVFQTVLRLHNSPLFMKFSVSLSQCLTRFIRADKSLLEDTVIYLAKHWPTAGIKKQVAFTEELGSLMQNFAEEPITREAATMLFERLSTLVTDPGVDIAEAALSFLIGPGNEATLIGHMDAAMKQLVSSLNSCRKDHWNVFIRDDARLVLDLLSKASPMLFSQQVEAIRNQKKTHKAGEAKRVKAWQQVFQGARKADPHIRLEQRIASAARDRTSVAIE